MQAGGFIQSQTKSFKNKNWKIHSMKFLKSALRRIQTKQKNWEILNISLAPYKLDFASSLSLYLWYPKIRSSYKKLTYVQRVHVVIPHNFVCCIAVLNHCIFRFPQTIWQFSRKYWASYCGSHKIGLSTANFFNFCNSN